MSDIEKFTDLVTDETIRRLKAKGAKIPATTTACPNCGSTGRPAQGGKMTAQPELPRDETK